MNILAVFLGRALLSVAFSFSKVVSCERCESESVLWMGMVGVVVPIGRGVVVSHSTALSSKLKSMQTDLKNTTNHVKEIYFKHITYLDITVNVSNISLLLDKSIRRWRCCPKTWYEEYAS
jgi:hypothetical protein